jgi:hypothetical protein
VIFRRLIARVKGRGGGSHNAAAPWGVQSHLDWRPTHQHRKGGLYRVLAIGVLEADRTDAVIYDDAEGHIWVRAKSEFCDGRFLPVGDRKSDILNTEK